MMNWMAKTGKAIGTKDDSKYNTAQTTGSKEEDIINNVFDLYGCHYEWTLEADTTYTRFRRGGYYGGSYPPSRHYKYYYYPYGTLDVNGSRLTLYVN